jgi:hypothetical protein
MNAASAAAALKDSAPAATSDNSDLEIGIVSLLKLPEGKRR